MMVQIEQLLVVTRHHAKQTGRQEQTGRQALQGLHASGMRVKAPQ